MSRVKKACARARICRPRCLRKPGVSGHLISARFHLSCCRAHCKTLFELEPGISYSALCGKWDQVKSTLFGVVPVELILLPKAS
jgi:hypothetical protein